MKAIRFIQQYLIYSFPFVIGAIVWSRFLPLNQLDKESSLFLKALWEVSSWNLMIWFLFLAVFLVTLVLSGSVRETTLRKIGNLKDEDEREEYLTGRAAKFSYISTLSLLIFFLFLSVLNVKVAELENPLGDKHHSLSIGINFRLFNSITEAASAKEQTLLEFAGVPLSQSSILLLAILWLLVSFNFSMRKEMRVE